MITVEKVFKKAVQNFDFEKVLKIAKILNYRFDSVDEMKNFVKMLFNDAIICAFENDSNFGVVSSGGFQVSVQKDKKNYYVKIKFIIEEGQEDSEGIEYDESLFKDALKEE